MKIHIETGRLIIRDIEKYDAQGMFELDSDPDVHTYIGNETIKTLDEAKSIIDNIRKQYVKYGIGRWAIVEKSTDEFIGWTGLKYEQELREDRYYYDLGYRLKKKYWGKGIGTETAIESLKFGFTKLGLDEIDGAAHIDNIASNKILKKVGLRFIETFKFDGSQLNWYELKKSEWLDHQKH
ncbi:MAG: GNAT family N-acetyltransferase [Bacteroidota bacterium]